MMTPGPQQVFDSTCSVKEGWRNEHLHILECRHFLRLKNDHGVQFVLLIFCPKIYTKFSWIKMIERENCRGYLFIVVMGQPYSSWPQHLAFLSELHILSLQRLKSPTLCAHVLFLGVRGARLRTEAMSMGPRTEPFSSFLGSLTGRARGSKSCY